MDRFTLPEPLEITLPKPSAPVAPTTPAKVRPTSQTHDPESAAALRTPFTVCGVLMLLELGGALGQVLARQAGWLDPALSAWQYVAIVLAVGCGTVLLGVAALALISLVLYKLWT